MRRVTTTLALALSLLGCELFSNQVPLLTVDRDDPGGCILSYTVLELIADPTFGTVYTNGDPVKWPRGYTARRAGTEVEVLDAGGNVVLTTGRRYMVSPTGASMGTGEASIMSGSCIRPCVPIGFIKCELGESGPL